MKIDIHAHTKRCKKGDPATREISPTDLCATLARTDVRIIGITNHNVFDLAQYEEIQKHTEEGTQAWPGVELDIVDAGDSRGHLIVIVSPSRARPFDEALRKLTDSSTPDDFTATIEQVLASFDQLGPLYVAHYKQKKPSLSETAIGELMDGTAGPSRVIKEVSNAISAGIYISHGFASIYGSDIRDWEGYAEVARGLPDLRLPVDSFEHFCLLLEKDPTTINTALDRKTREIFVLQPFEDETFLKLTFFNDINVVFGAKGTGKSCILQAIEEHYRRNGVEARVFESGDRLDDACDLKGKDLQIDLSKLGLPDCTSAIERLRNAKETNVTPLSKYVQYFSAKTVSRNADRIRLKDIDLEEDGDARRNFEETASGTEAVSRFLETLRTDAAVRRELDEEQLTELEELVAALLDRLRARREEQFSAWKSIRLLNEAVKSFRSAIARKTGRPAKPGRTGFHAYATNRLTVARDAGTVVEALDARFGIESELVGSLGEDKGDLTLETEIRLQDGTLWDSAFTPTTSVKKTTQKEFAVAIRKIHTTAYRENLFACLAELDRIDEEETIKSLREMLLFKRHYALAGRPYVPSSGEAAMLMLEKELRRDAEIYILDEPERSLGNEYISKVIVPLIKGHARAGKRVFISTHDANIAVRTLPYCSVYRAHDAGGYKTYVGNPFSNDLVNVDDDGDKLDWRVISMRTLEGGEDAFGERGRIYGQR